MTKIVDHPGVSMHGECYIVDAELLGITELPADATERISADSRHLVAHSESGHHHYVAAAEARLYGTSNPDICYLVPTTDAYLRHAKSGPETHGTQRLQAGKIYRISIQREAALEGWRRVAD